MHSTLLRMTLAIFNYGRDQISKRAFDEVWWRKILRICNRVAHSIAREALLAIGTKYWKHVGPPYNWFEEIVRADMSS